MPLLEGEAISFQFSDECAAALGAEVEGEESVCVGHG
jgi:hypothetical protein